MFKYKHLLIVNTLDNIDAYIFITKNYDKNIHYITPVRDYGSRHLCNYFEVLLEIDLTCTHKQYYVFKNIEDALFLKLKFNV